MLMSDQVRRRGTFVASGTLVDAKHDVSGGRWVKHNVMLKYTRVTARCRIFTRV